MQRHNTLPRVIVIAGPTASGKSAYAVRLAKKIHGEIISADSRQVYKGLNIGTAKLSKKEMRGVAHYCINIASPRRMFTVHQFQVCAKRAMETITKKGKTPIIVGGTGFYIDAVLYKNSFPNVPPNLKLRISLGSRTAKSLFSILKKLDPARARTIDPKNPRRLIRAIEIAHALGRVPKIKKIPRYGAKIILLSPKPAILKKRIARRTNACLRRGLVAETKKVSKLVSKKRFQELGFEYTTTLRYIERKISKQELIEKLNTETWRYAKRQTAWFKKYL